MGGVLLDFGGVLAWSMTVGAPVTAALASGVVVPLPLIGERALLSVVLLALAPVLPALWLRSSVAGVSVPPSRDLRPVRALLALAVLALVLSLAAPAVAAGAVDPIGSTDVGRPLALWLMAPPFTMMLATRLSGQTLVSVGGGLAVCTLIAGAAIPAGHLSFLAGLGGWTAVATLWLVAAAWFVIHEPDPR